MAGGLATALEGHSFNVTLRQRRTAQQVFETDFWVDVLAFRPSILRPFLAAPRLPPTTSVCTFFSVDLHPNEKGARRCVMNVLVTIPACSHQRPERHAHRGLRDDGVPVLHVQPVPTRLRQLRVVVQELEQDDDQTVTPRPEPQHAAMSDQNRALGQKAD